MNALTDLPAPAALAATFSDRLPAPVRDESQQVARLLAELHGRLDCAVHADGRVASTTDTDYFRVSVAAGRTLSATLNHTVSTQNYQLYLYNAAGTSALASSTRAAGQPETVTVRNGTTAAVNYLVRVVYASGGTGSTSGRYVLNLLQQ